MRWLGRNSLRRRGVCRRSLLEEDLEGAAEYDVEGVALLTLLDGCLALAHVPHLHTGLGLGLGLGVGTRVRVRLGPTSIRGQSSSSCSSDTVPKTGLACNARCKQRRLST